MITANADMTTASASMTTVTADTIISVIVMMRIAIARVIQIVRRDTDGLCVAEKDDMPELEEDN